MAKIIIAGDAVVIQAGVTLESIKTLEKYSPKSLILTEVDEDGKKQPVFRVMTTKGSGSASAAGICFAGASHDGSGLATVTAKLPDGVHDAKAWVADEYGVAVVRLNQLEETFEAALADVDTAKAAVEANIEIL